MATQTSSAPKVKVTASLDAELVRSMDKLLETLEIRSRSQLIEKILIDWLTEQKKREIESQVEEYYLSLSDEERTEDRDWNKIASRSAQKLWED